MKPIIMLIVKAMVADHFAVRLTTPFSRQAVKWGPKRGCVNNWDSSAGLLRAKQKAANIKNGTVGNRGKNAPTEPSATDASPAAKYSLRRINAGVLPLSRNNYQALRGHLRYQSLIPSRHQMVHPA